MAIDEKPSRNEDEYFAKQDAELRRQMRERLDRERAAQSAGEGIKCPRCSANLREEQRESVKLDTCPACGGIWLDKGELEMLMQVERGRPSGFLGSLLARK
jgi:uncharacterized protein with PIN domain